MLEKTATITRSILKSIHAPESTPEAKDSAVRHPSLSESDARVAITRDHKANATPPNQEKAPNVGNIFKIMQDTTAEITAILNLNRVDKKKTPSTIARIYKKPTERSTRTLGSKIEYVKANNQKFPGGYIVAKSRLGMNPLRISSG
jgi:hypothetical protein